MKNVVKLLSGVGVGFLLTETLGLTPILIATLCYLLGTLHMTLLNVIDLRASK